MPKDMTPSKELQEMQEEELTAEPSLEGLLGDLDLEDPKVKQFFSNLLAEQEETDEDGIRAEALRRSRVRQHAQAGLIQTSSPSPKNTPPKTE
jgi:hypothetical protein